MKQFTVGPNDAGQRLDRFLRKVCPHLPSAFLQKAIRLKKVRVSGVRAKPDDHVSEGDAVTVWLEDRYFDAPSPSQAPYSADALPPLDIVFEDANILLVGKPAGLSVHADETNSPDTLIDRALAYLHQKGDWSPQRENSFAPALCHRLDRNTMGLVVIAKTAPALRVLNEKMRTKEIRKAYLCVVHGMPEPPEGTLRHYLWKDARRNQVYVRPDRSGGAKTAVTHYQVLDTRGAFSLVRCVLETGRTHQIRVQLAHAGHPLLGDGKYGVKDNRRHQALCAYSICFHFSPDTECVGYLSGRSFTWPSSLSADENESISELWSVFDR